MRNKSFSSFLRGTFVYTYTYVSIIKCYYKIGALTARILRPKYLNANVGERERGFPGSVHSRHGGLTDPEDHKLQKVTPSEIHFIGDSLYSRPH